MKNKFGIVAILAMLLFASCAKNKPGGDIVDTWKVTEISYTGKNTVDYAGSTFTSDFSGTGVDIDLTLTFKRSKIIAEGSYSIKVTTTSWLSDMEMEMTWTNQKFMEEGTWEYSDGVYKFTFDGETQEVPVEFIDDNTMNFLINFETTQAESGAVATQKVSGYYTLERQ